MSAPGASGWAAAEASVRLGEGDRALLARAVDRARASGRGRYVAWVVEGRSARAVRTSGPADGAVSVEARGSSETFSWERVDAGERFCGCGSLDEIEAQGPERFALVRDWHRDLTARLDWLGRPRPATRPIATGGFGFEAKTCSDPDWKSFPAARFVLPELLVEHGETGPRRVVFARVEPTATPASVAAELERRLARCADPVPATPVANGEDEPEYRVRPDRSHARFRAQVEQALAAIAAGPLEKLVLARSLLVAQNGVFDVPGFLARLRDLYPSCTVVAVRRGGDSFLAATPETLVRVAGDRVETAALAGSAPRGRTPEEDRALGEALFASPKERAEHAHVVRAIERVLAARCASLVVPAEPGLRRIFGIQHLETRIEARLPAPRAGLAAAGVLGLVEALHPTAAVAGEPRGEALRWLRQHEGLVRGWYAAPIGWLDGEGGGDFRVALRSALIRNGTGEAGGANASRARLFAGVGIVAGSLPEQELVETRIKLRALLAPLTEI